MKKGAFKAETNANYTAWDLNCRNIIPHTPTKNKFEKTIKRSARRKAKERLRIITKGE